MCDVDAEEAGRPSAHAALVRGLSPGPTRALAPPKPPQSHIHSRRSHMPPKVQHRSTICQPPPPQGGTRREGTSEVASEAVRQAVGGGCQSGWGRLLSVTNAIEAGTWCQGDCGLSIGWALWTGEGGAKAPPLPMHPCHPPLPRACSHGTCFPRHPHGAAGADHGSGKEDMGNTVSVGLRRASAQKVCLPCRVSVPPPDPDP